MQEKKDIYEQLYDYSNEVLKRKDKKLQTSKTAYLFFVNNTSNVVDVAGLLRLSPEIDNMEFVRYAYFDVLGRVIDEKAINYWNKYRYLKREEFRKRVLRSLLYTPESKLVGKKKINNMISPISFNTVKNLVLWHMYYDVFLNMPKGFQSMIRKLKR